MSEFRITGEGTYRRRNGHTATIAAGNGDPVYPWHDESQRTYTDTGRRFSGINGPTDIVSGPLASEPELAGLDWYLYDGGPCGLQRIYGLETTQRLLAECGGELYDLRQLPASAIVTAPKPELKRIEIWKAIWKRPNGDHFMGVVDYPTQYSAQNASADRNTLIAVTCTYSGFEGEGMEGVS